MDSLRVTANGLLENYGLHRFALHGDDEGVRQALRAGADINALDEVGRTAIMCAVAGENWQDLDAYDASFMSPQRINALKIMLTHPAITLLTLNATHASMNGVIPLGMAAWLNQPQAVRTLLEDSVESVSVDGMDSHGATALMYAARDGNLEVVQTLLSRGARPDFRDRNNRSSIQFARTHPQILWLCESILRHHRWRESQSADKSRLSVDTRYLVDLVHSSLPTSNYLDPPPSSIFTPEATSRFTEALISSIRSSDISFIHSSLFSPALQASSPPALYPISVPSLVNLPDVNGWSLVHHCVAVPQPSIDVLDTLYCAGADITLFTVSEEQTPLHILARFAGSVSSDPDTAHSLHRFCLHLIHDLRAPLSARDKDDETCLHIAAEHGHSADLLILLLDCDTTGAIRKMKNSRGLTPFEVAKEEFVFAFSNDKDTKRSASALSNYTIRATSSFASLSSVSGLHSSTPGSPSNPNDSSSIYSAIQDVDVDAATQKLLTNLRATSLSVHHPTHTSHIQSLQAYVEDTNEQCNSIVCYFRGRIEDLSRVVHDLRTTASRIDSFRCDVAHAANEMSILRGVSPIQSRKRARESEDSRLTVVHEDEEVDMSLQTSRGLSVGTQTSVLDHLTAPNAISTHTNLMCHDELTSPSPPRNISPTKVALKLKQVLKKSKKLEEQIRDLDPDLQMQSKGVSFRTSRVKAWLKRMVVTQQPSPKIDSISGLASVKFSNVGHEAKAEKDLPTNTASIECAIDTALKTSQVVLHAVHCDLLAIDQCIESAQQFIDLANHSISRVQRVVKRAVKKREAMINDLLSISACESRPSDVQAELSPSLLGYDAAISQRPSLTSISTIYSTASSVSSIAATVAENDDEDIRIVRRLLLRKIEAQTSGAWDEVDTATGWLNIVKEAVRSVKRRAYL